MITWVFESWCLQAKTLSSVLHTVMGQRSGTVDYPEHAGIFPEPADSQLEFAVVENLQKDLGSILDIPEEGSQMAGSMKVF